MKVPEKEASRLEEILRSPDLGGAISSPFFQELLRGNFLVADSVDELAQVRQFYEKEKNSSVLNLTIAPTLACNFACPYCFEHHRNSSMSEEVQAQLFAFVKKRLAGGATGISLGWYGGEPLLVPGIIERLSRGLMTLAAEHGAVYDAGMTTNGYLLTRRNAELLAGLQVSTIQVTLDGPPAVHDQRRPLVSGRGTFDVIIDNLRETVDLFDTVTIRVNIDKGNTANFLALLRILDREEILPKVNIYLGQVEDLKNDAGVGKRCLASREYSAAQVELYLMALEAGYRLVPYPSREGVCAANSLNGFVFSPEGNMFGCWNDISDDAKAIGSLGECRGGPKDQWLRLDPFQRQECLECSLLPICCGGCPYRQHYREQYGDSCTSWKHNLEHMVMLRHLAELQYRAQT